MTTAEAIANILTSKTAPIVLGCIVLLVILIVVLVKKGIVSYNGKGFRIGGKEHEVRVLLLRELSFCEDFVESSKAIMIAKLKSSGYECDEIITSLIFEKVLDLWLKVCCINNINNTDAFINTKIIETHTLFVKEIGRYAPKILSDKDCMSLINEEIGIHVRKCVNELCILKNTYKKEDD